MATIDYWAEAPLSREQIPLFDPTLDGVIAEDDSVRLFDEVLGEVDWSPWEAEYHAARRGQPPIHPRHVAGAILYGLCRGLRSSRKLEEATVYRLDFRWLLLGRRIDHTTLSKFRGKFRSQLKDLFKQLGRIAMTIGLIRLGEVAFDGTRVKANNSRYATRTAKTLAEKLAALDALFDEMMDALEATDAAEQKTFNQDDSPTQLPPELAELDARREKIRAAMEQAQAADEQRKKKGVNPEQNPAQTPTTDPDSRVMPNKEGGYAPNYTPVATTDGENGFIVDCDVTDEVNEASLALPSVENIEAIFGEKPEKFLTDAGNNHGHIMQQMEEAGVAFYAPATPSGPQEGNPAKRDDPTQPVPQEQWNELPRNSQKKLDKSCFVYDDELDQYHCPQGETLAFEKTKPDVRGGARVTLRVYRCDACAGCPLAEHCVSSQSKGGRTITRDGYEEVRDRTAARMATEEARELYNQRPRIAETTFGNMKSILGLRQFLLRGLENVKHEWQWACTAFNLGKLVRHLARLRAEFAQLAADGES